MSSRLRRTPAPLAVHFGRMSHDLYVNAQVICEGVQGAQTAADVIRLALVLAACSLKPVPWVDLQNPHAVPDDGDLGLVEKPFQ